MSDSRHSDNEFLDQIGRIIDQNLSNELFGVSGLADAMNMSRSNLLRKVKKLTKLSVSQLISQVRLKRAMEMLRKTSFNVSEVSHQVGFNSTSYFIKCFREYYGYPPGEVGKRSGTEIDSDAVSRMRLEARRKRNFAILISFGFLAALTIGIWTYFARPLSQARIEKSIAVLPFKNDSNDSTNVYLINGLMESTLNNLQKIKDLKVISRTSTEKYRNAARSIPEMARELNVNYFVEGSGQKIGEHIVLNIQLIDGSSDKHLWSRQYRREAKDIFALQEEISKDITGEIQAIITPEEMKRIEKKPTDDLVAYDFYLQAKNAINRGGPKGLEESIPYFKKAIDHDPKFALAYAEAAGAYYYLDLFQTDKKYTTQIGNYADKALLLDPKLAESLISKALFYVTKKEYDSALPYLEKALEYNPNSMMVINFLSEFYNTFTPNSAKYLENALKAVRLDIASKDSVAASYVYLHLSNAFMQTGFIDEAIRHIDKSLSYNPRNPFGYVRVFFLYARDKDLKRAKDNLIVELKKDSTRIDIIKEVAKLCYYMRDYPEANKFFKRFIELREAQHWDIFQNEHLGIAMVMSKMGEKEKAETFLKSFKKYVDSDRSIYKHLQLGLYYAYLGDARQAIDHLNQFSKEDNYQYWILLLANDPVVDPIRDLPEFKKVMRDIESKFWNTHDRIRSSLEEKGLLQPNNR